jgi:hypothetical protein
VRYGEKEDGKLSTAILPEDGRALDVCWVLLSMLHTRQNEATCGAQIALLFVVSNSRVFYSLFALDMETDVPPIAVLPLPTEEDSLAVLDAKLSSYLYVVHISNSIDTATGSLVGGLKMEILENQAINGMKPREREYYQAWKRQSLVRLPTID